MNIAVINIKDLIKYVLILVSLIILIIASIKIVKGKEELKETEMISENDNSSFLYCLDMEVPLMSNGEDDEVKQKNVDNKPYKILEAQIAMLYNIGEKNNEEKITNEQIINNTNEQEENKEEDLNKTIEIAENLETKVINENNIAASFTDAENDIQIKNQSKYDVKELIANSNYQLKNKDKVIIYHTHTCESYTSSEKYNYDMTGTYRTTDLNYTVAKVRRRIRGMLKAIRKNSST